MKPTFFYGGYYKDLGDRLKTQINSGPELLSSYTIDSPRSAGDAIEMFVGEKFDLLLGDWCKEFSSGFARRSMADIAFKDKEGFYCVVDVKTHREDTGFNMPNLISVERLARFYEDDKNIFACMVVKYRTDGKRIITSEVTFAPIEFLSWDCLTVGALGWGQIQIRNSNEITINDGFSRKKWMLMLCETMFEFYPREISKIQERLTRFANVKSFWENKDDIWD